jgi:hypothetical protein
MSDGGAPIRHRASNRVQVHCNLHIMTSKMTYRALGLFFFGAATASCASGVNPTEISQSSAAELETPSDASSVSATLDAPASVAPDAASGLDIDAMIADANGRAAEQNMHLRTLTRADFDEILANGLPFLFWRSEREDLATYLRRDVLPEESEFELRGIANAMNLQLLKYAGGSSPHGLITLIVGQNVWLETVHAEQAACRPGSGDDPCQEPFSSPIPPMATVPFPAEVPVKVTPIEVGGTRSTTPMSRDALRVQLLVRPDNIADIANHFSVSYSTAELTATLVQALGGRSEAWIDVQDLWTRWIGSRVNTFPEEGDLGVCHGLAREFFYDDEVTSGGYTGSTEAVEALLHDHYCPVPDDVQPRFGDYLWVPGTHSGRFILRDPASGRDISFSVQSGGVSPYRLYWMDEDFSGKPFQHEPVSGLRKTKIDVWRRCR